MRGTNRRSVRGWPHLSSRDAQTRAGRPCPCLRHVRADIYRSSPKGRPGSWAASALAVVKIPCPKAISSLFRWQRLGALLHYERQKGGPLGTQLAQGTTTNTAMKACTIAGFAFLGDDHRRGRRDRGHDDFKHRWRSWPGRPGHQRSRIRPNHRLLHEPARQTPPHSLPRSTVLGPALLPLYPNALTNAGCRKSPLKQRGCGCLSKIRGSKNKRSTLLIAAVPASRPPRHGYLGEEVL